MSGVTILTIILQVIPLIVKLIGLLKNTPEQDREKIIVDLHNAFNKAQETGGDTSAIEEIIKRGKK